MYIRFADNFYVNKTPAYYYWHKLTQEYQAELTQGIQKSHQYASSCNLLQFSCPAFKTATTMSTPTHINDGIEVCRIKPQYKVIFLITFCI